MILFSHQKYLSKIPRRICYRNVEVKGRKSGVMALSIFIMIMKVIWGLNKAYRKKSELSQQVI